MSDYVPAVVRAVDAPVDALVSPPTDHAWQAKPYRQALATKFRQAVDLTDR